VGWSWPALSKLTVPGFALLSVALQTRSRKNAHCRSHSIQFMCIQHSRELLSTSEYGATVRVCIYDVIPLQTTITIFTEITNNSTDSDGRNVLRCGSAPVRLLGLQVRIPLGGMSLVCCVVEVSANGRSLVRRSPTECGVSECDRGTSRRPWRTRGCRAIKIKI
jgi:hypothetical protein